MIGCDFLTNQIVTALWIISNNFPSLNSQSRQELPLCLLYWSRPPASVRSLSKITYRRTSQQNVSTSTSSPLAFQSRQYAHLTREKTDYTPALPPVPPVSGPAIQLMKLSHTVNCFLSSVRFLLRKDSCCSTPVPSRLLFQTSAVLTCSPCSPGHTGSVSYFLYFCCSGLILFFKC